MGQRTSDEGVTSFITTPKVTHQRLKLLIHGTTTNHQPIIYLQDQVKKVSLTIFCINNFITTKIKLSSFCPCLIYMLLNFIKLYQIILDCILT